MGFCIPPFIMDKACQERYYAHRQQINATNAEQQIAQTAIRNDARAGVGGYTGDSPYSDAASVAAALGIPIEAAGQLVQSGVSAYMLSSAGGAGAASGLMGGLFGAAPTGTASAVPAQNVINTPFGPVSLTSGVAIVAALAVAYAVARRS